MKTLTEQFAKILESVYWDAGVYRENPYIKDLIQAVKERDAYVIGQDFIIHLGTSNEDMNGLMNYEKEKQRKRAISSL